MKKKTHSTGRKALSSTDNLLKLANRVGTQSRRADNLINWRKKTLALLPDAKDPKRPDVMLKIAQAQRDAGVMDADLALCMILNAVESLTEETIMNDPKLKDLSEQMGIICKREGLGEDDCFDLKDPKTPKDWLALNAKYEHRLDEIQAAALKAYGEDEIADICLTDQVALNRRMMAGIRQFNIPRLSEFADHMDEYDRKMKDKGMTLSADGRLRALPGLDK